MPVRRGRAVVPLPMDSGPPTSATFALSGATGSICDRFCFQAACRRGTGRHDARGRRRRRPGPGRTRHFRDSRPRFVRPGHALPVEDAGHQRPRWPARGGRLRTSAAVFTFHASTQPSSDRFSECATLVRGPRRLGLHEKAQCRRGTRGHPPPTRAGFPSGLGFSGARWRRWHSNDTHVPRNRTRHAGRGGRPPSWRQRAEYRPVT